MLHSQVLRKIYSNFWKELGDQGVQVGPEKLKTLKEQLGVLNHNGLEVKFNQYGKIEKPNY